MKKNLLLIGVAGVFAAYTFVLRGQHNQINGTTHTPALVSPPTSRSSVTSGNSSTVSSGAYKDGTYTGTSEDAFYGNVQVSATISSGKITSVTFLTYPNSSPNSQDINVQAMPLLRQEAVKAQSANVDIVSGATQTSEAFAQSLQTALQQAKA